MTRAGGPLRVHVPGDKSISHRALLLGALGAGTSRITGLLDAADTRATASVLRALGVAVPALDAPQLAIAGVGLRGLRAPVLPLDCANSGTTARLMAGVLAGVGIAATLTGDASLSRRPMRRVAAPLEAMGAEVVLPAHGGLPLRITRGARHGVSWHPEVASAQVKGAVLLAGLTAGFPVEVHEPLATRDHTERMLLARGVRLDVAGNSVVLHPEGRLDALDMTVPGDVSSAAFWLGLVALGACDRVVIERVGVNPGRLGVVAVLRRMGLAVRMEGVRDEGGEPVADVVAEAPATLRGTTVVPEEVPASIDELPLLACVAAHADGETRITGAGELRVKESDRIRAVVANLRAVGGEAEELPDGLVVRGAERPLAGVVDAQGDHRVAMAFGVLGARAGNAIRVTDPSCVEVSYPRFWHDLADLQQR